MSATPRTDKQAVSIIGFYSCATVPAEFARELETENAALQTQNAALVRALSSLATKYSELRDSTAAEITVDGPNASEADEILGMPHYTAKHGVIQELIDPGDLKD